MMNRQGVGETLNYLNNLLSQDKREQNNMGETPITLDQNIMQKEEYNFRTPSSFKVSNERQNTREKENCKLVNVTDIISEEQKGGNWLDEIIIDDTLIQIPVENFMLLRALHYELTLQPPLYDNQKSTSKHSLISSLHGILLYIYIYIHTYIYIYIYVE